MPAFLSAFVLAVALAMDAFAVAMAQGAAFRPGARDTAKVALLFGGFQGAMPLIGWAVGELSLDFVAAIDHWIAFGLLGILGLRMIVKAEEDEQAVPLGGLALVGAAVAESIDALAAGFTLPAIGLPVALTCIVIAVVTTILSAIGVGIGSAMGQRFGRPAEMLGGAILIAIGTQILADHMGWL